MNNQKILLLIVSLITLQSTNTTEHEPRTVSLIPPYLDTHCIVTNAYCDRPSRIDGVNISLETSNNKTIVHCYGHGGSGYTTLFGSIQEAIALLETTHATAQTAVKVIGSGCMGLTMAIELYHRGFMNISIATKEKYNIPSWRAAGLFDPGIGTESSSRSKHHAQLGLATYQVLFAIEQGEHPYLTSACVRRLPLYYPKTMKCAIEILEKLELVPPSELVTLDFGNGVIHKNYKRQDTYFINVTELMRQLWHHVEALNIPVILEEIHSFDNCKEDIICNCTGLGSRTLNNDTSVYPVRGHFYMLKNLPDRQAADYMLFTRIGENREMLHWFPKPEFMYGDGESISCNGMLGGTAIAYEKQKPENLCTFDENEFKKLIERAQQFFYGRSNCTHQA